MIAAATHPGPVHLTVANLERSLDYYGKAVGPAELDRAERRATLGAGERELLVLVEEPGAGSAFGHTGLYHFALLVPERIELARWLAHAGRERIQLVGLSDHAVSESIYLADPDGHGIEIYADRPREIWEGQVATQMTTMPLDVQGLIGELPDPATASFEGLPAGTVMGHVHLRVADIPATITFYRDLLGFDLMAELAGSAAFLSAGGYHHHIGANIWESAGASPPPTGSAALRHATFLLPDESAREEALAGLQAHDHEVNETEHGPMTRDPSGNTLVLELE